MSNKQLKIVLMGKKSWAAKAMEHLLEQGHTLVAVVGKERREELDAHKGSLTEAANLRGIPTLTSGQLYQFAESPGNELLPLNDIDLVISYLFWEKVKEPLLSLPKIGAINFHPAPLPDLKGLGGYNMAIIEGRSLYGVTAHYMDTGIDEGDIIRVRNFKIDREGETALSLEQKSQIEMFELFKEVISQLQSGHELKGTKQNCQEGIYIDRKMFEAMKYINPEDHEEMVKRKIRAFWYPPYEGAKIKIGAQEYTVVDNAVLRQLGAFIHSTM